MNMPQMLSVTTEVRFSRANSEDVIRNASTPGNKRMPVPSAAPFISKRCARPSLSAGNPSTGTAKMIKLKNITGARKKIDENGFAVAGLRSRRIWVRDHLKPDEQADAMTRMNPRAWKAVSPATIMMTPRVMMEIMNTRRHEGCSRRKRNAKIKTKPRADDLHIAARVSCSSSCVQANVLKKVNEINFKLVLPRPMSMPVAAPHGPILLK